MKRFIIIIAFALISFLTQHNVQASENLKVVASFYPLAHFAEQVAGEFADITNIMPPGAEPHEFEPTPRDIKKIYDSDVFLFHGAGLDTWAERIRPDLLKKGTVVVEMAEQFSLDNFGQKAGHENHARQHAHGKLDPHIWLDPLLAQKEVEVIRDIFIRVDSRHEDAYRGKSALYIKKLNELHEKFNSGLKNCAARDIIVTHNAFNYMAGRYGLHAHAITGISPEEEPSPRKMVKLSKLALKKNIKYIFFEKLASPKLAETIAHEVGAKTLVLNPVGGLTKDDIEKGKTYISVMNENLHNLRIALECK